MASINLDEKSLFLNSLIIFAINSSLIMYLECAFFEIAHNAIIASIKTLIFKI